MSLKQLTAAAQSYGFPRLRGDEPGLVQAIPTLAAFSPPTRG